RAPLPVNTARHRALPPCPAFQLKAPSTMATPRPCPFFDGGPSLRGCRRCRPRRRLAERRPNLGATDTTTPTREGGAPRRSPVPVPHASLRAPVRDGADRVGRRTEAI